MPKSEYLGIVIKKSSIREEGQLDLIFLGAGTMILMKNLNGYEERLMADLPYFEN